MATDGVCITAALSTRNHGSVVAGPVRTILENDHPHFEVIVVDQSDDDFTRRALDPFLSDSRFHYFHCGGKGRSAGLNAAIRRARGALVAITDDDCMVPPDWLRQFERAFAIDSRNRHCVRATSLPARHDFALGCIPCYVRSSPFLAQAYP